MNYYSNDVPFESLKGLTLTSIENDNDVVVFTADDGQKFIMYHDQNCCETVAVDDIAGELDDLIGSPILLAEEVTSGENPEGVTMEYQDSFTWTFYKLATIKGAVTIRWYGESNGYYSEAVSFSQTDPKPA